MKELKQKTEEALIEFTEKDGNLEMCGTQTQLREIMGSSDTVAASQLLGQLFSVIAPEKENNIAKMNAVLPIMRDISPSGELESMLAVQMIGNHFLTMSFMARAATSNDPDFVQLQINRVTKLSRTFLSQLEALNKHRGKGQQKMTVEHVHISGGGQAVIGNVGGGIKTAKQPINRSGASKGNQNALKNGRYTKEQLELQGLYRILIKQSKQTLEDLEKSYIQKVAT